MNFKLLTTDDREFWNNYLFQLPADRQDIYYTPEYYSLYEKLGDGKAECFVFEHNGEIALYPYLINSINELGYNIERDCFDIQGAYGYNGVVSSCQAPSFVDAFYKSFTSYANEKNIIAEFTRFHPLIKNNIFSQNYLSVIFDRKTVYVDLSETLEHLFSSFQTTTRKQIKRAINRYGIKVSVFENGKANTDEFLKIYNEAMKRVASSEYLFFNKEYFEQLLDNPNTVLFNAEYNGTTIASIITIRYKNYLHGHLGGALTNYLSYSPYSLLYYEIIKYGQKEGLKSFHVGGGTTGEENDPLLKYKLNFSNTTADFFIGKKVYNENVYKSIVAQWTNRNPDKTEQYQKHLLNYRY